MTDSYAEGRKKLLAIRQEILLRVRSFRRLWPEYRDFLREINAYANYHPISWSPIYEAITTPRNRYRLENTVFANFYTSIKHPWPVLDGRPLAPLLQLDIKSIRGKHRISGQFGRFTENDGLLQVWTTHYKHKWRKHGDGLTRFIPAIDVNENSLTENPSLLKDSDGYLNLAESGFGRGEGLGARIVGWRKNSPQYISYPSFANACDFSGFQLYKELLESDNPLALAKRDANKLMDDVQNLAEPVTCVGGSHLFGVSKEHQGSDAWEMRPWQTLFQFDGDGDYDYRIGHFGTAVVYWRGDEFYFSNSPYG